MDVDIALIFLLWVLKISLLMLSFHFMCCTVSDNNRTVAVSVLEWPVKVEIVIRFIKKAIIAATVKLESDDTNFDFKPRVNNHVANHAIALTPSST